MRVTFLIPGALRAFAGGQDRIRLDGSPVTVADALELLWAACPGIRDRMANEQGQIREHINVFVGNENIRDRGGLGCPLSEGAEISIIPAISGG
jgi:molybdopterin synthase sulfur carrier subunit